MKIIGCMSGTSLDGLDLALCEFLEIGGKFEFQIVEATTFDYTKEWKEKLNNAPHLSGFELSLLDNEFGRLTGQYIAEFIKQKNITNVDYIASHGHTVFHQPQIGITLQIGKAINIAKAINLPVINDFRSLDVSLNGQGAPLVPIGDQLLFSEYDYCLNLGGFSNVSFVENNERLAFDIAPANLILNYYSKQLGFEYDNNGNIGKDGDLIPELLSNLNQLPYYQKKHPKSLGKEWLDEVFFPLIPKNIPVESILRTLYEHIALQIGSVLNFKESKTLVTGGGAFNSFLIELIQKHSSSKIIIPDDKTINFKEALIFAFLGYLRAKEQINVLKSVTGANKDSCSGNIVFA